MMIITRYAGQGERVPCDPASSDPDEGAGADDNTYDPGDVERERAEAHSYGHDGPEDDPYGRGVAAADFYDGDNEEDDDYRTDSSTPIPDPGGAS
jgi:hypothetical protein